MPAPLCDDCTKENCDGCEFYDFIIDESGETDEEWYENEMKYWEDHPGDDDDYEEDPIDSYQEGHHEDS